MRKDQLIAHIQKRVKDCESQVRLADKLDISAQYLNDVLAGKREPGAKLLAALGAVKVVTYHIPRISK